jgi:hypothetical protein
VLRLPAAAPATQDTCQCSGPNHHNTMSVSRMSVSHILITQITPLLHRSADQNDCPRSCCRPKVAKIKQQPSLTCTHASTNIPEGRLRLT